jgi:hypothetical protein
MAKEAIDKPDPAKKSPFKRVQVWTSEYPFSSDGEYKLIEVTGVAEGKGYDGSPKYWASDGKNRKVIDSHRTYVVNLENNKKITEITKLNTQIEALREMRDKTASSLEKFKVD